MGHREHSDLRLVLLVGLTALGARLVYLHVAARAGLFPGLFLDSLYYAGQAAAIRSGHGAGNHPFLMSPLYPYFLAAFTDVHGHLAVSAVRLVQALAGSFTAVLVALCTRRICGRVAGWIAGLLAAVYGPSIHYDAQVLVTSLQTACVMLALWWVLPRAEPSTPDTSLVRWIGTGTALGLAAALHPTGLVLILGLAAVPPVSAMLRRRPVGSRVVGLCGGAILMVLPFTVRNVTRGDEWILLSANGGFNFWVGNHAQASGVFSAPEDYDFVLDPVGRGIASRESGSELTYRQASRWWRERAVGDILTGPARWLGLLAHKLLLFVHPREIPQLGDSFDWFRDRAWPLRCPVDARHLWILATLAPIAAILDDGMRTLRRAGYVFLFVGLHMATILMFFAAGRYRAPLMPAVIILAAVAGSALVHLLRSGTTPRMVRGLGVLGALILLLAGSRALYGSGLDFASVGSEERHQGMALYEQARYEEAVAAYRRSLALRESPETRTNLANALKALGRVEEAAEEYLRVLESGGRNPVTWYNLGNLLRDELGDPVHAADAYRNALRDRPLMPEAHLNLGLALIDQGRFEEAVPSLEQALALAPAGASWTTRARQQLVRARSRLAEKPE